MKRHNVTTSQRHDKSPRRARSGFTLIETIATIAILATLASVASSILMTAMKSYTDSAIVGQLDGEESMAMERIVRELRKIPKDTGAGTNAPLISAVTASS